MRDHGDQSLDHNWRCHDPILQPIGLSSWSFQSCPKFSLLTSIANCNTVITDCNMTLGEKLRYLREVEGTIRGLDRELSQIELARLIQKDLGKSISQIR